MISGLVYEVGVPGGADLPAVLARVAGVALHVLGLHVVLDGGQVGRCVVTICIGSAVTQLD